MKTRVPSRLNVTVALVACTSTKYVLRGKCSAPVYIHTRTVHVTFCMPCENKSTYRLLAHYIFKTFLCAYQGMFHSIYAAWAQ